MRAVVVIVFATLSVCCYTLANPVPQNKDAVTENEKQEKGVQLAKSPATANDTHPHDIAHGCEDAKRAEVGLAGCIYYCKYVSQNNTWLYGHYIPYGIDCWADDVDSETDKDGVPGRCYNGLCYPDDHDAIKHLPPRTESPSEADN
ncbi:uncharacterized protein LOC119400812 [Rhipicephalus sanguineus]|uniref:uncharacterized protein LOC119400812 n=1 Tax=Rhipicephalus sanguineus TaxID=34632 RepID=UPI0018952265|nr:uncharacterized protein LOC119400812 [Rhipicephalus sanguineus]